ncbi:hypothetical protein C8Q69DRAFT_449379 [Paecilomyces variotii]|uniref:Uncharacterized protein n=1 Tax=Byssochlamys spectabilis TaxID=264951 RepID=A0A443I4K5_BYSSP|nr:hypothetical protein C8Q69DRAFT_449379 [Paecilomyces variotii]RWQ98982.1 hypothetical protein C8Q69DRAFT_449379 [Paecilomyces variotii]
MWSLFGGDVSLGVNCFYNVGLFTTMRRANVFFCFILFSIRVVTFFGLIHVHSVYISPWIDSKPMMNTGKLTNTIYGTAVRSGIMY